MEVVRSRSEQYFRLLLLDLAAALRHEEYETAGILASAMGHSLAMWNAGHHDALDKVARRVLGDA